jgi:5-methylthioadenosine/S-adenosylhomocysteine deaminase
MKLASGIAPVPEMIQKGLHPGLGTDGCASNNNLDLLQEMDTAAKLGKVHMEDPVSMGAETVLKMATKWGAGVMGLEPATGTLEKGKKADLIVIDVDSPHLIPLYNPGSTIVYAASGADVKDVVVNGRILLKDREFQTLDREKILGKVGEISRKIKGA